MTESTTTVLFCPACKKQHIDEGEWAVKPHHTHRCVDDAAGKGCGTEWRLESYVFGVTEDTFTGWRERALKAEGERDWWQKKHEEDNEGLVFQVSRLQRERDDWKAKCIEARRVVRVLAAGIASDCFGMLRDDEIEAMQTALAYPDTGDSDE